MHPYRIFVLLPVVLTALLLLGCSGCADHATEERQVGGTAKSEFPRPIRAADAMAPGVNRSESLKIRFSEQGGDLITEDWFFVTGKTDEQNRYLSTVEVLAEAPTDDWVGRACSGVLVGPRLVLTAGNCVCGWRKISAPAGSEQTLIDATVCATEATITTAIYEPSEPARGLGVGSVTRSYGGEVRPHPALKILLDKQGNIVSSESDLAVIWVNVPLQGNFPPVELGGAELKTGDSLVMVGYGYDAVKGPLGGTRRFREYSVTKVLDSGARALFDQPKRHIYKGDSGGPCLRETRRGLALVGIMNRSLGAEASFTSTYFYRDWLRQEIQHAVSAASPPH